jgi:hypothetical protein
MEGNVINLHQKKRICFIALNLNAPPKNNILWLVVSYVNKIKTFQYLMKLKTK